MDIGDVLKIAFFVLLVLALALAIANYIQQASQPKPQLVMNIPAGLYYRGPETTAIAGWYCIESINFTNGYSIQLNAWLDNELKVQNAYGTFVSETTNGGAWVTYTALLDNVWTQTLNGTPVPLHVSNPSNDVINAPCAWLVIALKNGVAYFGYSLDGRSIVWYDSYPVNADYIISTVPGLPLHTDYTGIVLAGPGNGAQAQLNSALVYLALYYWNGTTWVPAPVGVNHGFQTGETVNNAWVYASNTCGGVVSWPNPVNNTQCPSPPSFKP
jgi:Thermopsin.